MPTQRPVLPGHRGRRRHIKDQVAEWIRGWNRRPGRPPAAGRPKKVGRRFPGGAHPRVSAVECRCGRPLTPPGVFAALLRSWSSGLSSQATTADANPREARAGVGVVPVLALGAHRPHGGRHRSFHGRAAFLHVDGQCPRCQPPVGLRTGSDDGQSVRNAMNSRAWAPNASSAQTSNSLSPTSRSTASSRAARYQAGYRHSCPWSLLPVRPSSCSGVGCCPRPCHEKLAARPAQAEHGTPCACISSLSAAVVPPQIPSDSFAIA